jgi:hypothetical protein
LSSRPSIEFQAELFLRQVQKEGYFRETSSDQMMEKVDADGNVIGFSVLKVSAVKGHPLELTL